MLLLTGPPGSGKTHEILDQVRDALRRGEVDFRLLVPTATMAEHLRNQLAREGFVFRPSLIGTLSRFIEPWVGDLPQVSAALLELLTAKALRRKDPAAFRAVSGFRGFHSCVARLIDEISAAGCDSSGFPAELAPAFVEIFREVENEIRQQGAALRGARLLEAAGNIDSQGLGGIRRVFLDGFFSLADPELSVIRALCRHADVTVSLPCWEGAEASRETLVEMGLTERRCGRVRSRPETVLLAVPTIEQEVEEIARRILAETSGGRPFREFGIIVRSPEPYVPILRSTLERFGIPARFYFAGPPADHAVVRYLGGAINAMLGGWSFEQVLNVLWLTPSGLAASPEMDDFDVRVRQQLPAQGIEALIRMASGERLRRVLEDLSRLDFWRGLQLPAKDWAARVKTLAALYRPLPPTQEASHGQAAVWRSYPEALKAFEDAIEETAEALEESGAIPLDVFWEEAKTVLRLTTLRTADRRRNVVHVLDVYESRQWELPVVFVCGLLEQQFPVYHAQDPVLPDEARLRLRKSGLRLRTAAERDREEEFLFEIATSRATRCAVLSYPQFNRKGDANLPSFYLDRLDTTVTRLEGGSAAPRWRLEGANPATGEPTPIIRDKVLSAAIGKQHKLLSATGIESFLQCPFQFFAGHTLKLAGPPVEPEERLDASLQGNILHRVLAEWIQGSGRLEELFERAFSEACQEKNVPPGYRTEAVRLELLRNLRRFAREAKLPGIRKSQTEREFRISLAEGVTIRGRFDRVDFLPDGRPLVIDYKYSRKSKVQELVRLHEEGARVQGSLYMLAAEREFGAQPAGFLFAGLREEVSWEGRHVEIPDLDPYGSTCTPEELRSLSDRVKEITFAVAERIAQGRRAPDPADRELCASCDFADICRVESMAKVAAAGEVQE